MARTRKKNRTHNINSASAAADEQAAATGNGSSSSNSNPRSFVVKSGKSLGSGSSLSLKQLVKDMRKVMEPNTAIKLKVNRERKWERKKEREREKERKKVRKERENLLVILEAGFYLSTLYFDTSPTFFFASSGTPQKQTQRFYWYCRSSRRHTSRSFFTYPISRNQFEGG